METLINTKFRGQQGALHAEGMQAGIRRWCSWNWLLDADTFEGNPDVLQLAKELDATV